MTILWPNGSTSRPPISSGFGPRNLDNPLASKYHLGVDMYDFDTVHAIADGTVVYVGWYSGVGWSAVAGFMVWVQHDGFFSRALHNDAGSVRVKAGDRVRAGDPLVGMGWSGLQGPWATHVHLEVTPGQWHTTNTGQVDPVPFIEARIGQTTGGGGVVLDESEEDDMRYIENIDTGVLYQVAPEWINALKPDSGREKAWRDAGLPEPVKVKQWSFDRILAHYGCLYDGNAKIVNDKGDVLNVLEGGGYERFGTWSRVRKIERRQWLQMKE